MVRKILFAVDGSKHCERALEWYASNMRNTEDQLIFAYVVEPPPVTMGAGFASAVSADLYANSVNEAIQAGKRLASQTKDKCESLGLQNHTRFLERMTSGAGPALVEIANEEDVSLVVMGNRGMGTLRRTFLGSVSDYVLHHAHRPTIIVPPAKTN